MLNNYVRISGHVGADPRFFDKTTAVARLRVATNTYYKDRATGEVKKRTDWHNAVAFGTTAERVQDHVRKGWKVDIEGQLRTGKRRIYTDDDDTAEPTYVDDPYIRIEQIEWKAKAAQHADDHENHDDDDDYEETDED